VIPLLLEKGADPNAVSLLGMSPLHFACDRGLSEVSLLLEKGANPNVANKLGLVPMDYASNTSTVEAMLKAGAIPSRLSQWRIRNRFPECIPLMERILHTKGE
jgi:ankyrin repeat protein